MDDDEEVDENNPSVLPESISISKIEDLLAQMRFHEVPKRAQFSIPFELGKGLTIGIKGYFYNTSPIQLPLLSQLYSYGLITEQKKGQYKYFADLGDRMEVAEARTTYADEVKQQANTL
jgi:ATP-dependent DNA helicase 2 subunit 1